VPASPGLRLRPFRPCIPPGCLSWKPVRSTGCTPHPLCLRVNTPDARHGAVRSALQTSVMAVPPRNPVATDKQSVVNHSRCHHYKVQHTILWLLPLRQRSTHQCRSPLRPSVNPFQPLEHRSPSGWVGWSGTHFMASVLQVRPVATTGERERSSGTGTLGTGIANGFETQRLSAGWKEENGRRSRSSSRGRPASELRYNHVIGRIHH